MTLNQIFCFHLTKSKPIDVSGTGYSEYQIVFCKRCDKAFVWQKRGRDGCEYGNLWDSEGVRE